MKPFLPILLCGCLAACNTQKPLLSEAPGNNQTYKVDYLFEKDGCRVYRFKDRGAYIYFTSCNGEAINSHDSTVMHTAVKLRGE